jgi:hypothetical protein
MLRAEEWKEVRQLGLKGSVFAIEATGGWSKEMYGNCGILPDCVLFCSEKWWFDQQEFVISLGKMMAQMVVLLATWWVWRYNYIWT